jgi:DNA repair photolyase
MKGKIWECIKIRNEEGELVDAIAPVIISASRSTDIPSFFGNWFIESLEKGYVIWKNPFNGKHTYVSFKNTRLIVFWTKNARAFLPYIDELDRRKLHYYFQFTLNSYDKEVLEKNLPSLDSRITVFKNLSLKIGKEKVIWRFDPLVLSDNLLVDDLVDKISEIADQLCAFTNKLVFSFVDISQYPKVKNNLSFYNCQIREFSISEKLEFAEKIGNLNKKWNLQIASCSQSIDLEEYGIIHNKCIDDELIIKLFSNDSELMNFLGYDINGRQITTKKLKDKGQRKYCRCVYSKDIGQYNTCGHNCVYCYANSYK